MRNCFRLRPDHADVDRAERRFRQAKTEAANRAEVTALLIRFGYSVYRPEADCEGEDLIVRAPLPSNELRAVQLKGRPTVDFKRYGGRGLWMLFPSAPYSSQPRTWYLVPHDKLHEWVKDRHGADYWHYPSMTTPLRSFLEKWAIGSQ
jgi:hypothetical protein